MAVIECAPEAIVNHEVHQLGVAHAGTLASFRHAVGGVRHRLHAPGDHRLDLACPDELIGEGDGVEARQADLVDGDGGDAHAQATLDGGLPCRDLALAGLQDVAHDHVVDRGRVQRRAPQCLDDGSASEIDGGQAGEGAEKLADGGPCPGDDDRFAHAFLL